jgi:hypothetical protein
MRRRHEEDHHKGDNGNEIAKHHDRYGYV